MRIVSLQDRSWSDERGWGLQPLKAAGLDPSRLGEMHVVSLEPGAVRGNHVHPETTEWMLLCGGPMVVSWRADAGSEEAVINGASPALLEIPPGVAHAVRSDADRVVYLLCWSDGEPVTERLPEPLL